MATRIFFRICLAFMVVGMAGCKKDEPTRLQAKLEILTPQVADPFQFRAIATIENPDAFELEISGQELEQIEWNIQAKGSNDSLLPLLPKPAIPDPAVLQAPAIRIEPGKSYSQNVNRLKLDWPKIVPGPIMVRFKVKATGITDGSPSIELVSEWQSLEILPGTPEPDIPLPQVLPENTPQ